MEPGCKLGLFRPLTWHFPTIWYYPQGHFPYLLPTQCLRLKSLPMVILVT